MSYYFENLNGTIKEYFHILSSEPPDFLEDYIATSEMQRLSEISIICGTYYSKMFDQIWYSRLDHSVAVALIIWNFTKSKKQTLAGLFHDIATPVFSHTIDFMNGDYEKQEFTEGLTTKIITESKEIMRLLERDSIKIEEVNDYHIYPIADNDTPRLSSDRLEYTFSNGFGVVEKLWNLKEIKVIYENIEILKNEYRNLELGFKNKEIAEKFVATMSRLSCFYRMNKTHYSMQFLADVIRKMCDKNLLTIQNLYQLSEKEVIGKIENCEEDNIAKCFALWKNATQIKESDSQVEEKYCVSIENVKIRYINPLVNVFGKAIRVNEISKKAREDIEKTLHFKTRKYAYLDFNFS